MTRMRDADIDVLSADALQDTKRLRRVPGHAIEVDEFECCVTCGRPCYLADGSRRGKGLLRQAYWYHETEMRS